MKGMGGGMKMKPDMMKDRKHASDMKGAMPREMKGSMKKMERGGDMKGMKQHEKGRPDVPMCMMGRVVEHNSPARLTDRKVGTVMHEFKEGTLRSGSKSGPKVKSRKQAMAIAMSEAGMSKKGHDY